MNVHTSHVAEARDWLKAAADATIHLDKTGEIEALVSQRNALIGVGHAILALTRQLYDANGGDVSSRLEVSCDDLHLVAGGPRRLACRTPWAEQSRLPLPMQSASPDG